MATIASPASSSPHDDENNDSIPMATTLALPSTSVAASTARRLPPPCWSPEETVALIDAYRDKWYSLRRGNLRANHWQEVADDVASRFEANPPKTAVQCRHKMEKLRKRYRGEIQRAAAQGGVRRFASSWAHFQSMHSMEKGPNCPSPPSTDDDEERDHKDSVRRINDLYNNNNGKGVLGNGGTGGVRIKIPGLVNPVTKVYGGQNRDNSNPRFGNSVGSSYGGGFSKVGRDGLMGVGESSKGTGGDLGGGDVVEAIRSLGEGFMRIEKAKMDMARQVEEMRMEMELKRTEMILESQQRIVDAFAKSILERTSKKAKRMSTP